VNHARVCDLKSRQVCQVFIELFERDLFIVLNYGLEIHRNLCHLSSVTL